MTPKPADLIIVPNWHGDTTSQKTLIGVLDPPCLDIGRTFIWMGFVYSSTGKEGCKEAVSQSYYKKRIKRRIKRLLRNISTWMISLAWGLVLTLGSPVYGRTIQWSGHEWLVRNSDNERGGPGPNYWSDSPQSVWVDSKDRLHLKIRYENGRWVCAEIFNTNHWAMADIFSCWLAPWVKWTYKPS